MTDSYKRGDRVKHNTKTDWGLGEGLSDQVGGKVQIIFEDADVKTFAISVAPLIKVEGEECRSEYLAAVVKRHLRLASGRVGRDVGPSLSFDGAVQKFLHFFPHGFGDAKYLEAERDYKVRAHRQVLNDLSREQMEMLGK